MNVFLNAELLNLCQNKSYIAFVIDSPLMTAQSRAESTRDTYNYEQYLNQFPPNTIKVIREFERIQKKICRHKMSIVFNEICIYIYIYIYIYVCVCVCVCVYVCVYLSVIYVSLKMTNKHLIRCFRYSFSCVHTSEVFLAQNVWRSCLNCMKYSLFSNG